MIQMYIFEKYCLGILNSKTMKIFLKSNALNLFQIFKIIRLLQSILNFVKQLCLIKMLFNIKIT